MAKIRRAFKKIGRFFTSKEYRYKKARRILTGTLAIIAAVVGIVAVLLMLFGGKGKPYHSIDYISTVMRSGAVAERETAQTMYNNLEFVGYSMRAESYNGDKADGHTVFTRDTQPLCVVESIYSSLTGYTKTVVSKGVKITAETDNKTDSAPTEDEIIKAVKTAAPQEVLGKYFENKSLSCYVFDNRVFLVGTVNNVDVYICSEDGGDLIETATIRDNSTDKTVVYKFNYYK